MPTYTPNYNYNVPDVGYDLDIWGGKLNLNFLKLDTDLKAVSDVANAAQGNLSSYSTLFMKLDGTQAMTAPLVLVAGNPTLSTHAASKGYVDTAIANNSSNSAAIYQAWKTTDQSVVSSTTFVNDSALQFSMVAGKKYWFKGYLLVTNAATSGIKLSVSATQTPVSGAVAASTSAYRSSITTSNTTAFFTKTTVSAYELILFRGFVNSNVTTGGTLNISFAQSASGTTATIIRAGSMLEYGLLG